MSRNQEIWNTYLQMKRNNSSKLSEFLSNDENKRVVKQKGCKTKGLSSRFHSKKQYIP